MWQLDHKEGWALKNWCFWTVVLEKTLRSLLDSKEIKPVNPKGNQPWIFFGRTDAETEASIVWPPDTKSWFIGKDLDTGKNWTQEEKGTTEHEMVGWASSTQWTWVWANSRDGEGQGSLVYCSHGVTKSWTWLSNWTIKFPITNINLTTIWKWWIIFAYLSGGK